MSKVLSLQCQEECALQAQQTDLDDQICSSIDQPLATDCRMFWPRRSSSAVYETVL